MCGTEYVSGMVLEFRARWSRLCFQPLPFFGTRWRAEDHGPLARLAVPFRRMASNSDLATAKRSGARRRGRQATGVPGVVRM